MLVGNRLCQKLKRLRDERRELKRRLRENQMEIAEVHSSRQKMVERSTANLDNWEAAEALDLPRPVMVPGDDGVMWDFTNFDAEEADAVWAQIDSEVAPASGSLADNFVPSADRRNA